MLQTKFHFSVEIQSNFFLAFGEERKIYSSRSTCSLRLKALIWYSTRENFRHSKAIRLRILDSVKLKCRVAKVFHFLWDLISIMFLLSREAHRICVSWNFITQFNVLIQRVVTEKVGRSGNTVGELWKRMTNYADNARQTLTITLNLNL